MDRLFVIKIGGDIIDDEEKLKSFLQSFASVKSPKILVHGGGKLATKLADRLGIQQKLIDGRRITDLESLKIVTMVYAGYINKNLVARLQANDCNAIGLSGADANILQAHKRIHPVVDYGYVGDIDSINTEVLSTLLANNLTIVMSPITHNKQGQLLNTNADTIAQELAKAMINRYDVQLIYCFEKNGVLLDANNDATVIGAINRSFYAQLRAEKRIFAGMIPKIDNAFAALDSGVKKVIIGNADDLKEMIMNRSGTVITNE
jgi:acetylglutamate kinase